MGKVNSHNTGKVWKKKHLKVMGFSNILGEAEIHTISYKYKVKIKNNNNYIQKKLKVNVC